MKQVLLSVDQYLKTLDFGSAKKHPYTGILSIIALIPQVRHVYANNALCLLAF